MNRRITTLIASVALAATMSANAAVTNTNAPSASFDDPQIIQVETQSWYFSGTARIISDFTKKEKSMSVYGYVYADSRTEALAMAKESGRAQAARRGRVLSVNIRTLY